MKYRVHLFATVRVEQEFVADSAAAAVLAAVNGEATFYQRFNRPGQEYAGKIEDRCVVDPLTTEIDFQGQLEVDYAASRRIRLIELPNGIKLEDEHIVTQVGEGLHET